MKQHDKVEGGGWGRRARHAWHRLHRAPGLRAGVALLAVVLPAIGVADNSRGRFQVSAYIPARASIEMLDAGLTTVTIDAADIKAGYKDVSAACRVRSNDPSGYLLQFAARTGLTASVWITGLAAPVQVDEVGTEVLQRPGSNVQDYRLTFRLNLATTVQPGTYPAPVVMGVTTL